jgi:hypothetical protein
MIPHPNWWLTFWVTNSICCQISLNIRQLLGHFKPSPGHLRTDRRHWCLTELQRQFQCIARMRQIATELPDALAH